MIKQASVSDVKNGVVARDQAYVVIAMRYYPRFLKKEFRDEFISDLAPVKELLHDFNTAQKKLNDHNAAFPEVDYESRFELSASALEHLRRLARLSEKLEGKKDVYILCICATGERCHREILMLLAKELFGCQIGDVYHSYPTVMRRLPSFRSKLLR